MISGGKLGNHCRESPRFGHGAAVIPDFRGSIWESLQRMPGIGPIACSDSGFQGVNLGITAGKPSGTAIPLQRFSISGPNLRIDVSFSPFSPSFVHRFLISRPNLRIDVSFSLFMPSCVHRFLISGPDLRIDVSFSPFTPSFVHRFLISCPNLRIDAAQSSWRGRMARLLRP